MKVENQTSVNVVIRSRRRGSVCVCVCVCVCVGGEAVKCSNDRSVKCVQEWVTIGRRLADDISLGQ